MRIDFGGALRLHCPLEHPFPASSKKQKQTCSGSLTDAARARPRARPRHIFWRHMFLPPLQLLGRQTGRLGRPAISSPAPTGGGNTRASRCRRGEVPRVFFGYRSNWCCTRSRCTPLSSCNGPPRVLPISSILPETPSAPRIPGPPRAVGAKPKLQEFKSVDTAALLPHFTST